MIAAKETTWLKARVYCRIELSSRLVVNSVRRPLAMLTHAP